MNNTDSLSDKARAIITLCTQTYGMNITLQILNGAIDGHIAENLRRETDEAARHFFMTKKRKLMELV